MRDPESLAGRVALVTGGSSGIGLAAVKACLDLGMEAAVLSRNPEGLPADLHSRVFSAACDVRKEDEVEDAVGRVIEKFGRIDLLVNAAGVSMPEPLYVESISAELWDRVVETNLRGTFLVCRAVLPRMKAEGKGLIINILSTGAYRSNPGNSLYSASKFGTRALTEALQEETRDSGIKVSSISPGPVATNIWSHKKRTVTDEEKRRMLRPEDIGDIVAFLCLQPDYVHVDNITVTPKFPKV